TGEAYDAQARGPNRKFWMRMFSLEGVQMKNSKQKLGLVSFRWIGRPTQTKVPRILFPAPRAMGFLLLGLLVTMLGAGSALADTVTCLMGNSMGKCIETTSNNGETLTLQVALSSFFDLTDVTIAGFGSSEVDVTRFSVTQPNANWTPTAITGGSPSPGYTETWNSA